MQNPSELEADVSFRDDDIKWENIEVKLVGGNSVRFDGEGI